jgi:hypothetical protein
MSMPCPLDAGRTLGGGKQLRKNVSRETSAGTGDSSILQNDPMDQKIAERDQ